MGCKMSALRAGGTAAADGRASLVQNLRSGEDAKGWLWKKGAKRHNWKRRWFVLQGGLLKYYTGDGPSAVLKGCIAMRGARVARHVKDGGEGGGGGGGSGKGKGKGKAQRRAFLFEVAGVMGEGDMGGSEGASTHGGGTTRVLQAESAAELKQWLSALQRAAKGGSAADEVRAALGAAPDGSLLGSRKGSSGSGSGGGGGSGKGGSQLPSETLSQVRSRLLQEVVVMRGELLKKGSGTGRSGGALKPVSRRNWKRRHFRITVPNSLSPNAELLYFASAGAAEPKGSVDLRGCEVREVAGSKYEHHFTVWHATSHSLMLRAASRAELLAWRRAIRIAIASCNPGWDPQGFEWQGEGEGGGEKKGLGARKRSFQRK